MKRTPLLAFLILTVIIIVSSTSCKEKEFADWKILNEQWYNIHKSDSGFVTTPSGLCYKVIHQGYQRHPSVNSYIKVNYEGKLIDGSVFDSGTNSIMSLSGTIQGWQEGIPKMQSGGTYIFYVPSALAYDTATTYSNIPPYSTLIFRVELVDSYN